MNNIFFLSNTYMYDDSIGITKKIKSQISAFNNLGYNVKYYTGYTDEGVVIYTENNKVVYKEKFFFKNKIIQKFFKNQKLKKVSKRFVKNNIDSIDIAYLRYVYFDFNFYRLLKEFKKKNKVVIIEAHTYPIKPNKISLKKIKCIIADIYTPLCKRYFDCVVGICDVKNIWGKHTINIDNGIDIGSIKVKNNIFLSENEIHLLSVSTERDYHGYDRVLHGLSNYLKENNNKIIFKIKFVGTYLKSTIDLVDKLKLNDYVEFCGRKSGNELDIIYDWADIGLGDLGRHRMGALSGSCLKTKEYFAKGLPFITSLIEPTYSLDYKYVLRFDANDDAIDFNKIIDFYTRIKNDKNIIVNMNKYAKNNFTWEKQLELVSNYLERVKQNEQKN